MLTLVFPVLYTFLAYLTARFSINAGLRLDIYMLPFLAPFQLVAVVAVPTGTLLTLLKQKFVPVCYPTGGFHTNIPSFR